LLEESFHSQCSQVKGERDNGFPSIGNNEGSSNRGWGWEKEKKDWKAIRNKKEKEIMVEKKKSFLRSATDLFTGTTAVERAAIGKARSKAKIKQAIRFERGKAKISTDIKLKRLRDAGKPAKRRNAATDLTSLSGLADL